MKMLIRHNQTFRLGAFLAVTFLGLLAIIFSPVFGGKNGLQYSDALFNKLAKGSSYFVPELSEAVKPMDAKEFGGVDIKLENADQVSRAVKILMAAGAQVGSQGTDVKISGNLGKTLGEVLKDSTAMYYNKGGEIKSKYGIDEKDVMSTWWAVLNKVAKEFQKTKKVEEASAIIEVMRKGIEPAYNFYEVEPQKVSEKAFTVLGLLVFYVMYTMWWGYAIFFLFDGLGLSMKKARVKKEV
jgi:hypothetical protein